MGRFKPWAVALLKYGVSLGIIGWLVADASKSDELTQVLEQPKDWSLLTASWAICFLGVVLSMLRWRVLVRALGIEFGLLESLQLSFLGYLFNFVSLGAVGGDLVKAVVLARSHPGRRADAVASVLADRIIGLYSLMLFASAASLATGQWRASNDVVRVACRTTILGTLGVTVGMALFVLLGQAFFQRITGGEPRMLKVLWQLLAALDRYRQRPRVFVVAMAMSAVVHASITTAFYLISQGLPGAGPGFSDHLTIVPLATLTGVLPLPVNGLGALEAVVEYLYLHLPAVPLAAIGKGLSVALVYRAITMAIALVGAIVYLYNRRQVAPLIDEAATESQVIDEQMPEAHSLVVTRQQSVDL